MGKEYIYFEKQDDLMCGQHAMNMLVQAPRFDASHFALVVERLDRREMELTGVSSHQFRSQNASESGYFSIQVLKEVLISDHILLFDINKPKYAHFMFQPEDAQAFLINQNQHWFILRRFGDMWFILNSLSSGPRYISTPLLQPYVASLINNGASIYVIEGDLGMCEADLAALNGELTVIDAVMDRQELDKVVQTVGNSNEDEEMQRALAASLEYSTSEVGIIKLDDGSDKTPKSTDPPPPTEEEIRLKRAKFLDKMK